MAEKGGGRKLGLRIGGWTPLNVRMSHDIDLWKASGNSGMTL